MNELITSLLLVTGGAFLLLAGVGIVRMPDLYSRIQAATKAATLGIGCIVLAIAIHFTNTSITIRAVLVIAFLFFTAPVAAHVIARAAYFVGVPLWKGTIIDELRGRYDTETHTLQSTTEQMTHSTASEKE